MSEMAMLRQLGSRRTQETSYADADEAINEGVYRGEKDRHGRKRWINRDRKNARRAQEKQKWRWNIHARGRN